jgi:uncharacterized repeat protein (TIGR01451 family)
MKVLLSWGWHQKLTIFFSKKYVFKRNIYLILLSLSWLGLSNAAWAAVDYGDAPNTYGTAAHTIINTIFLGAAPPDAESASLNNSNADGDDTTNTDDEDGVTLPSFGQGKLVEISVKVSGANAYLQAWIDFNGNGVFDDNEKVARGLADNATGDLDTALGTIRFAVSVPLGATTAKTYARFRWSSQANLTATATASDGEVEDYALTINPAPTRPRSACPVIDVGGGNGSSIAWPGTPSTVTITTNTAWSNVASSLTLLDANGIDRPISGIQRWDKYGDMNLTLNFSPAIPASEIILYINDVGTAVGGTYNPSYTFSVTGQADRADFVMEGVQTSPQPNNLVYIPSTGTIQKWQADNSREHGVLMGLGTDSVSQISLVSSGISSGDFVAYLLGLNGYCDFGDAPDNASTGTAQNDYATLYASGAPFHQVSPAIASVYLGKGLTRDVDGLPNATATGDSEDDGLVLETNLLIGSSYQGLVTVKGSGGYLYLWVDWNQDGDFADTGEQVLYNLQDNSSGDTSSTSGRIGFSLIVPSFAKTGQTFARLRWTTDKNLTVNTRARDGEIEDYQLNITHPGYKLSGRVFNDINVNGNDDQEAGISKVTMVLWNKASNSCQSTRTKANGSYSFSHIPAAATNNYVIYEAANESVPQAQTCPPIEADPNQYLSNSANSLNVTVNNADITNLNFADVKAPSFTLEHTQQTLPNSIVWHSHRFQANSDGQVQISVGTASANPAAAWNHSLWLDQNCNQQVDSNEAALPASVSVKAGDKLCILLKVHAPAEISEGATYALSLNSVCIYGNGTTTLPNDQQTRRDLTIINQTAANGFADGAGKLELAKTVWNISRDVSGETALPGEVLSYTLHYTNVGTAPLNDVQIQDSLPNFTQLQVPPGMQCLLTPQELSNCLTEQNGNSLLWQFQGALLPGSSGSVGFNVQVE